MLKKLETIYLDLGKLIAELKPKEDHDETHSDKEDTKSEELTPLQKLEKRLKSSEEKLEKLTNKTKSKNPDKDEEEKKKLTETIEKLKTKIAESTSKESLKTEKPKVEKKEEKRIARMTPAITKKLKEEISDFNDEHKKKFVTYVNELSEDKYRAVPLEEHIKNFAKTLQSPPADVEVVGGGAAEVKTVAELHKMNSDLEQVAPGIYRHKSGKIYTGPAEDEDEDMEDEITLDGKEYVKGVNTERMYLVGKEKDEFVGYWGVGEFYDHSL